MRKGYFVLTVDVLELIRSTKKAKGKTAPEYKFSVEHELPSFVVPEIRYDNALFYQILCVNESVEKYDPYALYRSILFLDFKGVFAEIKSQGLTPSDIIQEIDAKPVVNSTAYHLRMLLDPGSSITVVFPGKKSRTFSPFERSASMSKACRLSYVDTQIRSYLDERLCLGIDFSRIDLVLSKYYAYRGLYLTSGTRIPQCKSFKLDPSSVVVIPDLLLKPTEDFNGTPSIFTAKRASDNSQHLKFFVEEKEIESNAFDGEGLISPDYAEHISKVLGVTVGSIQVRMPWVKGMLHKTDFHSFLSENSSSYKIKDVFGIPRDLSNAQIILTESMFKCCGWLRKYFEMLNKTEQKKYGYDPMRLYFSKFGIREYDHALYVSGSDASFHPDGYDRLNYQFLDTLLISPDEFNGLIDEHFRIGEDRLEQLLAPISKADALKDNRTRSYMLAAKVNPYFYSEPRLKSETEQFLRNMRLDCGMGTLYTRGEHRYLSGDLMAFLWYLRLLIIRFSDDKTSITNDAYFEKLGGKILRRCFYMPDSSHMELSRDAHYAIFRNPHLSRNEEYLMGAYIPKNSKDPYLRYFGDLKGIIMVPVNSLAFACCSGADADGDEVKIYSDTRIVDAVKGGCYSDDYVRNLPIVDIPKGDSVLTRPTDALEFVKLIINTFSNYTGQISILSVRFADQEYRYSTKEVPPERCRCPRTTIVAGMEIDSCKLGSHPYFSIDELEKMAKKDGMDGVVFTQRKKAFESVRGYKYNKAYELVPKSGEMDGKQAKSTGRDTAKPELTRRTSYAIRLKNTAKPMKFYPPDKNAHNIMMLPYAFAERDCSAKDGSYLHDKGIIPEKDACPLPFVFDDADHSWINKLDNNKVEKVKSLVKSYSVLISKISNYHQYLMKKTNTYGKLLTLLKLKYDSLDGPISEKSEATVHDTLEEAIDLVDRYIASSEDAEAVLESMQEKWMYCKSRNARKQALCELLNIDNPNTVSDDLECLLCDFSFDGFYILYYLVYMAKTRRISALTKSEKITRYIPTKKEDKFGYYKNLLDEYKKYASFRNCFDQFSSENSDSDNEEEPAVYWKDALRDKAGCLIREIVSDGMSKNTPEKEINTLIVQYAHNARTDSDKNGTFFWDVIDKSIILENIKEVNRNAE